MLTPDEHLRYSRHLVLPEVGPAGQARLKNASVLLVGAGGLGSPLALYLAAAGVGRLGIVDFDVVEETNLQRQVLHGTSWVGRSKLDSARSRLQDLNPHVQVDTHPVRFCAANARDISQPYEMVIDGTDNFSTRYLTNDLCVLTGKPNVYGSIYRFDGQVSLFDPARGGPCYRCLYPEPPPPELAPSCAEGGVLGVLPAIVGSLQATEALKWLLQQGEPLRGRLLLVDALRMRFQELRIARDPNCPVCGDHPTIRELSDLTLACALPLGPEITVEELRQQAGGLRLLDVREAWEWELVNLHSLGAVHLPLGQLSERARELDASLPWVVYCKSGARSARAVKQLQGLGFGSVRSLAGGILAWQSEIQY